LEELILANNKPNAKNKRMNQVLNELIKNSNRSDHKLAKTIGISQPTVTRLRNQLEKEDKIQEYTIIPNLTKMGYSILAVFLMKYKTNGQKTKKMIEDISNGNSLFASKAQGMGKNAIMISLFKNYTEYAEYLNNISSKYDDIVEEYDSMMVDLEGSILKPFSLKYLVGNISR
jgi:DNA-binding Lrp family transcriptional regulator